MGLFGLEKVSPHPENTKLLATVPDNGSLAVIRSILDGAEIPYLIKERGVGSSVKIIAGFSMYGTDIFVLDEHYETAKELISPSTAADGQDEQEKEENQSDSD